MSIDLSSFKKVQKIPLGIAYESGLFIKITKTQMILSQDLRQELQKSGYPPEDNSMRIFVEVYYSPGNYAFRLTKPEDEYHDGFTFRKTSKNSGRSVCLLPTDLRNQQPIRGKYIALEDQPDVFVLDKKDRLWNKESDAKEISEVTENGNPHIGDLVNWAFKAKGNSHKTLVGAGIIESLFDKPLPDGTVENWAKVKPTSQNYIDIFPGRKVTHVKVSNLIIKEKK